MTDQADSTPRTVRVRLRVLITHEGKWAAYGYNEDAGRDENDVCGDMLCDQDLTHSKSYILEADVPVPQPLRIEGTIEGTVTEDDVT